jgi:hypothetical protein
MWLHNWKCVADRSSDKVTVVPDDELESLGLSADHKTWEAPDGTTYVCNGGFSAVTVNGVGTVVCGSST